MMNAFVFALTANGNSFATNAAEAGKVTLLGMVTIFIVLALLWGVIEIMHAVMTVGEKKKKKEFQTQDELSGLAQPMTATPAAPVADAAPAEPASDDGALIAVITAAVAATMAEEGYTGGFRVVSFKRASAQKSGRA